MAQATPGTSAMRTVVAGVQPLLKAAGFRKRRLGFNRTLEAGMTHVVHFQRGQKPGTYDRFTVNLGIFLPEVFHATHPGRPDGPSFINEYDCQIRERIGYLIGNRDHWWDLLEEDTEDLTQTLLAAIAGPVLSWFDERASSRTQLLDHYQSSKSRLVQQAMSVVAAERHERSRATSFMQAALDSIAAMERTSDREVSLHQGWIDQLRARYADRYELDVTYPVITPAAE